MKGTAAQAAATPALEKLQAVMASGQVKAVEALNTLADKMIECGNMEGLEKILDALTDIATGKKGGKESTSSDRFMEYLLSNQKSQQDMMMGILLDKSKGSNDAVAQSMGMFRDMLGVARELAPPGEDKEVAMAREIGDVVKDSMKEVTDTVRDVTGSGTVRKDKPQKQVVYHCSRCGSEANPNWKICPECGLVFSGKATPSPNASAAPRGTSVETFQPPAPKQQVGPRIPPGIRDKLGLLKNVAIFIRDGHDPVAKASGAFKLAGPEQRVQLLFMAEFGYKNLMKLANAYRNSPDIPERDAVFQLVESEAGEQWLREFFKVIKETAREEMVTLTDGDREHFINQLNEVSIQKFNFKAKPALTGPPMEPQRPTKAQTRVIEPPDWKEKRMKPQETFHPVKKTGVPVVDVDIPTPLYDEDGNPIVATVPMPATGGKAVPTTCPICGVTVMSNELKDHLFENHPKAKHRAGPSFHEVSSGDGVEMDEDEVGFEGGSLTG
jgi:rubrerythrin